MRVLGGFLRLLGQEETPVGVREIGHGSDAGRHPRTTPGSPSEVESHPCRVRADPRCKSAARGDCTRAVGRSPLRSHFKAGVGNSSRRRSQAGVRDSPTRGALCEQSSAPEPGGETEHRRLRERGGRRGPRHVHRGLAVQRTRRDSLRARPDLLWKRRGLPATWASAWFPAVRARRSPAPRNRPPPNATTASSATAISGCACPRSRTPAANTYRRRRSSSRALSFHGATRHCGV